jgi:hypothetical protein
MATVDKEIADNIIAGKYGDEGWVKIVKYINMAGNEAYGAVHRNDDPGRYQPSPWVRNPRLYWEAN